MSDLHHFSPPDVPSPRASYSHAVRSGNILWLAGQVPIDANGKTVGLGDVGAQTRQVVRNIGAILKACGASFATVVRFTAYVVGREHVDTFRAARAELWSELYPTGAYPTSTLLVVSGLASDEFLVEIEATAVISDGS
jgi:enamine deaminase RidA (YjgF/YER057c/UK114 family)